MQPLITGTHPGSRPAFRIPAALVLILLLAAPAFAQDVLVVHSLRPEAISDVQSKLDTALSASVIAPGWGASPVDSFDASLGTPTLEQLQAYDAVLVCTSYDLFDDVTLGDRLADYCDNGGTVIVMMYKPVGTALMPRGRWINGGYAPIIGSTWTTGRALLGSADFTHPLMKGVSSFDGGTSSYRCLGSAGPGAATVASWDDGAPLVVEMFGFSGTIVGLNFYGPSSDVQGDLWDAATDGTRMMSNAVQRGLRIASPSSPALPDGYQGQSYPGVTFRTSGGSAPVSWSVTSGALPGGLTLHPTTGELAGVPTASGTASFSVTATDAASHKRTLACSLSVYRKPTIAGYTDVGAALPGGTVGAAYSETLSAASGKAPFSWSASGLPDGLAIDPTSGLISGTPTAAGTTFVTLSVTDANGMQGLVSAPIVIQAVGSESGSEAGSSEAASSSLLGVSCGGPVQPTSRVMQVLFAVMLPLGLLILRRQRN